MANNQARRGHRNGTRFVTPDKLRVDRTYQRELNQKEVANIVANWNDDIFNLPKVSQRKDGSLYIFDGQHATAAHRKVYGEEPIECIIFIGLSWEQEKDLFVAQNGISSDPTTMEKLRAEYNGGNETVHGMIESCAALGVRVKFEKANSRTPFSCNAVAALYGAYMTLPHDLFNRMISVILKAWGGESKSLQAGFIKGLQRLYKFTNGSIKDSELIKSLSQYTPDFYIREAKDVAGSLAVKFCTVFLRVYNKKRTSGKIDISQTA